LSGVGQQCCSGPSPAALLRCCAAVSLSNCPAALRWGSSRRATSPHSCLGCPAPYPPVPAPWGPITPPSNLFLTHRQSLWSPGGACAVLPSPACTAACQSARHGQRPAQRRSVLPPCPLLALEGEAGEVALEECIAWLREPGSALDLLAPVGTVFPPNPHSLLPAWTVLPQCTHAATHHAAVSTVLLFGPPSTSSPPAQPSPRGLYRGRAPCPVPLGLSPTTDLAPRPTPPRCLLGPPALALWHARLWGRGPPESLPRHREWREAPSGSSRRLHGKQRRAVEPSQGSVAEWANEV